MFAYIERKGDRCETCKFRRTESRSLPLMWGAVSNFGKIEHETVQVLVCFRRPPTANKDGVGVWPTVAKSGWCGEFQEGEPSW